MVIENLRNLMEQNNIDTYIITKVDPHLGEYSECKYAKSVEFVSGFTGSFGDVVVTKDHVGLWTDGRYYIQASKQIGKEFTLHKVGLDAIPFLDFAYNETKNGGTIAFDGKTISYEEVKSFVNKAKEKNITINSNIDLLGKLWENRPASSTKKVFEHDLKFCGVSRCEKIKEIKESLDECDYTLIASLDDIAWTLNLRGFDVPFNSVFTSYLLVGKEETCLFIDENKLDHVKESLQKDNIKILPYENINEYIKNINQGKKVLISPKKVNYYLIEAGKHLNFVETDLNITEQLKAIKNETELENINVSNLRDCVALFKCVKEVKQLVEKGENIDEYKVTEMLYSERSKQQNFLDISFPPIVAYMGNAAMAHYSPSKENSTKLEQKGLLLIDSGGLYYDGTTDMTRTIALGEVEQHLKDDFTTVLKSHIAIATALFIEGTKGTQIDTLARVPMWEAGKDYSHGTGHGIGFCLSVHEGPQSISKRPSTISLEEGMVITNEPALYVENEYGIRTENTIKVVLNKKTEAGQFLSFETVSYFPIELDAINKNMLTKKEIDWLNSYHKNVYNKLSPYLNDEEKEFLKKETREI